MLSDPFQAYKVKVPPGKRGEWTITRFTITDTQARLENMRQLFNGYSRAVCEGTFTKLHRGSTLVMSDTEAEIRDHINFIYQAHGKILINGLGLGVALQACLQKKEVLHATVVEISEDLIKLVGSFYKKQFGTRLHIIHGDALLYQPPKGTRFNAVWHDIWDTINTDNKPAICKLNRKYGRRTDFQDYWASPYIKRMVREERAHAIRLFY